MNDLLTCPADIRSSSQRGFTLVELLVASAIVVILAALAVQALSIYREDAYHKIALQMMGQLRTALEAGKIDSESFPTTLMVVDQTDPGVVQGATGQLLLPGMVLPQNTRLYAAHNPACADISCPEDVLETRHCNIQRRVTYTKFHDGPAVTVYDVAAAGPCS